MKYKGIIFDFNGTLLFDEELHKEAWQHFSMKYFNKGISMDLFVKNMFGRVNKDIVTFFFNKELSAEKTFEYGEEKESLYRELIVQNKEKYQLADGVPEMLDALKSKNIPIAIATSSPKLNVDFYIDHFKMDKWFSDKHIIYDDGTMNSKPEPDIFLKASERLGLNPQDCIVFEDSNSGLLASHKANIGRIIRIIPPQTKQISEKPDYVYTEFIGFSEIDIFKLME